MEAIPVRAVRVCTCWDRRQESSSLHPLQLPPIDEPRRTALRRNPLQDIFAVKSDLPSQLNERNLAISNPVFDQAFSDGKVVG